MKVMGEVKSSSSERYMVHCSPERKSKADQRVDLGDGEQLVDQDIFVGPPMLNGVRPKHHGRHAVLAVPARIRAADAHVHRRRRRPALRRRPGGAHDDLVAGSA